jgi:hypothetical protein
MNACGVSRLLVPAFLVGLGVASLTGNDVPGWIAAGVTVGLLALVRALRGATAPSCAIDLTDVDVDSRARPAVGPRGRSRT